jgi:predicted regulator of Ras-like GTPase activity (Roadblock/LC7/MglB family)
VTLIMTLNDQPLLFNLQQRQQIDRCLLRLADQAASPLVMLADISGQLVLYRGRLPATQSAGLAALAAASFAANIEIGNFLGLPNNFKQQLLEGEIANLYTMTVGAELLLIIAFTQQTMLGLVRLLAQQAQHELLVLVRAAEKARRKAQQQPDQMVDAKFGQEVQTQLDDLFS